MSRPSRARRRRGHRRRSARRGPLEAHGHRTRAADGSSRPDGRRPARFASRPFPWGQRERPRGSRRSESATIARRRCDFPEPAGPEMTEIEEPSEVRTARRWSSLRSGPSDARSAFESRPSPAKCRLGLRPRVRTSARSSSCSRISGFETRNRSPWLFTDSAPSSSSRSSTPSICSRLSRLSITRSAFARSTRSSESTQQSPESRASSTAKTIPARIRPGWYFGVPTARAILSTRRKPSPGTSRTRR